jgi:formyl-CoA transferase
VAIVDLLAGLFATQAILAACYERQRSGKGQYIDVALFDSAVAALINVAQNHLATGEPALRYGNAHPNIVPYETVPTADGTMALAVGNDAQFARMCDLIGLSGLAQEPRHRNNAGRVSNRTKLMETLRVQFRLRTTEEWTELLLGAGIPAAPVNSVATALSDPQLLSRSMVQSVPHPKAGTIRLLGPVAKLSRTPAVIRSAPPLLGADTDRILAEPAI